MNDETRTLLNEMVAERTSYGLRRIRAEREVALCGRAERAIHDHIRRTLEVANASVEDYQHYLDDGPTQAELDEHNSRMELKYRTQ